MALADRAELAVRLTLDDRGFSGPLRRVQTNLKGLDKGFSNTQRALGRTGANLERVATVAAVAVTGGLIYAVKAAAEFEAQLLTINTIAGETTDGLGGTVDGLDKIGTGIRKVATETGTSLADLTAGYYDILSAGIGAADAQGVLEAANTLAIGGLATTAEAVDILTTAINAYGQDASAAGADADLFAKAIELGKVTADEIAASFANVAPIAATMGIELQEITAAYAALTAQGTPAAEVTTQMSRAILDLLSPNAELNALQKETGVNFKNLAEEKGLVHALQTMRDLVNDDEQAFKDLFGRVEGYKFALQTTGPQQEKYNAALAAMGDAGGTAGEQMAERMKGLDKQLEILHANLQGVGITLGTALLPQLTPLAQKLNAFLLGNQPAIEAFGRDLAGAFEAVGRAAVQIPWGTIKDGLAASAGFAKLAFDAFTKLPPALQQLLIGGTLLNKATGGLITGLGKDLGGLAFNKIFTGSFLDRGSTPANPMWVQSVGGPLGGPGGGAIPLGPGATPGARNIPGTGGGLMDFLKNAIPRAAGTGIAIDQTKPGSAIGSLKAELLAKLGDPRVETPAQAQARAILSQIALNTQRDGEIGRTLHAKIDTTNAKLEANRIAASTAATQIALSNATSALGIAQAIRDKQYTAPKITVNVSVPVTVRDIARKISVTNKLGFAVS